MSNLSQQIADDLKTAMKAKDQTALNVLRALKSAMQNAAIEKHGAGGELDDADAMAVVRKQIKQRQDSLESFRDAGRDDLAEKEKAEIEILEEYLPKKMSDSEIQSLVISVIKETGATTRKDMGKVMKILQERAAGRVDNKILSQEVMKRLNQ